MNVLCELVSENIKILRSKFTPTITHEKKSKIWRNITERVNSVTFSCERSIEEVKKRWQDAQSSVKKKEATRRKATSGTGGGPQPDLWFKPWEMVVLATLSPIAIEGITGGVDTSYKSSAPVEMPEEMPLEMPMDLPGDIVQLPEVEIDESSIFISGIETPNKDKTTEHTIGSKKRSSSGSNLCDVQEEYLQLEKKKMDSKAAFRKEILELERRKVAALESISISLQLQNPTSLGLSPIIKL